MNRSELLEMIQDLEDGGRQAYLRYDEMLDECFPHWIGPSGADYCPSDILREVDPVAYRCGFNDWADSEIRDLQEELDRLPDETEGES
jgi:hypothetical protein